MSFSSFSDFVAMGHHGLFVWTAYGVCFLVLAICASALFAAGISSITTGGKQMSQLHKMRLLFLLCMLAGIGTASTLVLSALRENINLFYTPTQIANGEAPPNTRLRAGGMVEAGSLHRSADTLDVSFVVTDFKKSVTITYRGILPDLFREGQGIVALGKLHADGVVVADEVLAKHDERYMPPEVSKALKDSGQSVQSTSGIPAKKG
jgi:cytochrome c-type biogenesis protein CcmE